MRQRHWLCVSAPAPQQRRAHGELLRRAATWPATRPHTRGPPGTGADGRQHSWVGQTSSLAREAALQHREGLAHQEEEGRPRRRARVNSWTDVRTSSSAGDSETSLAVAASMRRQRSPCGVPSRAASSADRRWIAARPSCTSTPRGCCTVPPLMPRALPSCLSLTRSWRRPPGRSAFRMMGSESAQSSGGGAARGAPRGPRPHHLHLHARLRLARTGPPP